ncbi:hypothetical protein NQ317_012992 [Molorchus minor]|uniref:Uncharacterized protein n=1 Tax=Molorchus minor TaxID=1323400 RepID=A0ABQ9JDE9_9CUCU|nr:hypothetical protein NQ317_012992 [Molorchus minor]
MVREQETTYTLLNLARDMQVIFEPVKNNCESLTLVNEERESDSEVENWKFKFELRDDISDFCKENETIHQEFIRKSLEKLCDFFVKIPNNIQCKNWKKNRRSKSAKKITNTQSSGPTGVRDHNNHVSSQEFLRKDPHRHLRRQIHDIPPHGEEHPDRTVPLGKTIPIPVARLHVFRRHDLPLSTGALQEDEHDAKQLGQRRLADVSPAGRHSGRLSRILTTNVAYRSRRTGDSAPTSLEVCNLVHARIPDAMASLISS